MTVPLLVGCAGQALPKHPATLGTVEYTPMTPNGVSACENIDADPAYWLDVFENETARVVTKQTDVVVGASFGAATVGYAGHSYSILIDYIRYTTTSLFARWDEKTVGDKTEYSLWTEHGEMNYSSASRTPVVKHNTTDIKPGYLVITNGGARREGTAGAEIPVHVGIGLRVQVDVQVLEGRVAIGSLAALGAAAEAKSVSGSLMVQTMGISGGPVSNLLPIPAELSPSSVSTVLQSVAAIKASVGQERVRVRPQVVGFESVFTHPKAQSLTSSILAGLKLHACEDAGVLKFAWRASEPDAGQNTEEGAEKPLSAGQADSPATGELLDNE